VSTAPSPAAHAAPSFAERLRAAHEREEKSRRSRLSWLRGPRAGFAPDVAIEPHDRPRTRDEFVDSLRRAS
jgi:hypothetical protein